MRGRSSGASYFLLMHTCFLMGCAPGTKTCSGVHSGHTPAAHVYEDKQDARGNKMEIHLGHSSKRSTLDLCRGWGPFNWANTEVRAVPKDRWADVGQPCECTWTHTRDTQKTFGIRTWAASAKPGGRRDKTHSGVRSRRKAGRVWANGPSSSGPWDEGCTGRHVLVADARAVTSFFIVLIVTF